MAGLLLQQAGAAAALTGLVFVGVSVSLQRILEIPPFADRALEAVGVLLLLLFVCSCALVPHQPAWMLGSETLFWAAVNCCSTLPLQVRSWKRLRTRFHPAVVILDCINIFAIALVIAFGVGLLWFGWRALPIIVIAAPIAIVSAVFNAWAVLIEIHRPP